MAIAGAALVAAGVAPMVIGITSSGADPSLTLTESAPASILYGEPSTVSLTASNGGTAGYNASFEDVLPAGVSYVAGSTTPSTVGDPTILTDEPSGTETTLIWSNVADIQPSSSFTLGFQLQGALDTTVPTPATIMYPGDSYTDTTSVYVNTDPREVPQFSASGAPSNYTENATVSGTTEVVPFTTTLTDPLPEQELERGVHDQKTIWTLTVTNNSVHSTALTSVQAWLPAGLEFLDCGGVDNTTTAPTSTYPSETLPDGGDTTDYLEYPGAPALTAGSTLPTTGSSAINDVSNAPCAVPSSVTTEDTSVPPGLTGTSNESNPVYTEVQWNLSGVTLGPGDTYTIRYLAAVPLLENTMTFNGGTPSGRGRRGVKPRQQQWRRHSRPVSRLGLSPREQRPGLRQLRRHARERLEPGQLERSRHRHDPRHCDPEDGQLFHLR